MCLALWWLFLGCGSADEPALVPVEPVLEQVEATLEVVVRPTATKVPRLDLPTLTPAPTATPWQTPTPYPTLDVRGNADVWVAERAEEVEPQTCVEHIQLLLKSHRGELHPEDVQGYLDRLAAVRGDCDPAEASYDLACVRGTYVGGLRLDQGFLRNMERYAERSIGMTRKDYYGNVLVHFEDLPGSVEAGCWYYSSGDDRWSWRNASGGHGLFGVDNSACDERLRALIVDGGSDLPVDVAGVVEAVWALMPSCKSQGWSPYPSYRGASDCGFERTGGALIMVRWQDDYLPHDGNSCWVYDGDVGEWYE